MKKADKATRQRERRWAEQLANKKEAQDPGLYMFSRDNDPVLA